MQQQTELSIATDVGTSNPTREQCCSVVLKLVEAHGNGFVAA
jgi:hypothetical protein